MIGYQSMKFLFIGDIVGRPGRKAVQNILPELKKKKNYDLVIANAENLTHGKGASEKDIHVMQEAGIDFFTSGNHIWRHKSLLARMNDADFPVIRPANYPKTNPGRGYKILEIQGKRVLIINMMGRVFMGIHTDCPFATADHILDEIKNEPLDAIIIDFHAEVTSEKIAFGLYLDGRVSMILGTHTHVPTADHHILEKGTGYITDVGMVGKKDSVIGVDKGPIIRHFLTQLPVVHEISEGSAIFNAVEFEIDPQTKKTISIVPIYEEYIAA